MSNFIQIGIEAAEYVLPAVAKLGPAKKVVQEVASIGGLDEAIDLATYVLDPGKGIVNGTQSENVFRAKAEQVIGPAIQNENEIVVNLQNNEAFYATQTGEITDWITTEDKPQQETSPDENPKAKEATTDDKDAEIQRLEEKLAKTQAGERVIPNDPMEKILSGVAGIITGEFRNLSSEVGWAIKAYCKFKGIDLSDQVVNNYLKEFATGNFRTNLETYIKSKVAGDSDPINKTSGLSDNEKLAMNWVGKLIGVAGSTPQWLFDGLALFGTALDYSAELLHHVPVIGSILKIPFVRKLVVGLSQFAGRFSKDIQLIADGSQILTGKKKPEEKK